MKYISLCSFRIVIEDVQNNFVGNLNPVEGTFACTFTLRPSAWLPFRRQRFGGEFTTVPSGRSLPARRRKTIYLVDADEWMRHVRLNGSSPNLIGLYPNRSHVCVIRGDKLDFGSSAVRMNL